ncbi:UNVERIFIED_CONTAM: hypothetical protein HDU68_004156 [Siphonaria sp. JEL0065]|nr:hypothetical protein HDU68_004156 [Siphonaria sp. JEL0065]
MPLYAHTLLILNALSLCAAPVPPGGATVPLPLPETNNSTIATGTTQSSVNITSIGTEIVKDVQKAGNLTKNIAGSLIKDAPQIAAKLPQIVVGAAQIASGAASIAAGNPLGGLTIAQGVKPVVQGAVGIGAIVVPDVLNAVAETNAQASDPAPAPGTLGASLPQLAKDVAPIAQNIAGVAPIVQGAADVASVLLPVVANGIDQLNTQNPNTPQIIQEAPQIIKDAAQIAAGVSKIARGDIVGGITPIADAVADVGNVMVDDIGAAVSNRPVKSVASTQR